MADCTWFFHEFFLAPFIWDVYANLDFDIDTFVFPYIITNCFGYLLAVFGGKGDASFFLDHSTLLFGPRFANFFIQTHFLRFPIAVRDGLISTNLARRLLRFTFSFMMEMVAFSGMTYSKKATFYQKILENYGKLKRILSKVYTSYLWFWRETRPSRVSQPILYDLAIESIGLVKHITRLR